MSKFLSKCFGVKNSESEQKFWCSKKCQSQSLNWKNMEDLLSRDQFATIYPICIVNSFVPIVKGSIVRVSIKHESIIQGSKHSVKHKEFLELGNMPFILTFKSIFKILNFIEV